MKMDNVVQFRRVASHSELIEENKRLKAQNRLMTIFSWITVVAMVIGWML